MSGKTATHAAKPASSSITTQAQSSVFRREVDKDPFNSLQSTIPTLRPAPPAGTPPLPVANSGHHFANIPVLSPAPVPVQAKLTVGEANDKYEQEADAVADQVMRMPEPVSQGRPDDNEDEEKPQTIQSKPLAERISPLIQRQIFVEADDPETVQSKPVIQRRLDAEDVDEEDASLQTKVAGTKTPGVSGENEHYINSTRGKGQPLAQEERNFFEPRFAHHFGRIRIHADGQAAMAARQIHAQAFTVGNNIFFGANRYQPGSKTGRRLLAHELTHTVQQAGRSFLPLRKAESPRWQCSASAPGENFKVPPGAINASSLNGKQRISPTFAGPGLIQRQAEGAETSSTSGSVTESVDIIIRALEGPTTVFDSALILAQFNEPGRIRSILAEFKRRTGPGAMAWLLEDLTAEHRQILRDWLAKHGVVEDLGLIVAGEILERLEGFTSEEDSKQIYALLSRFSGTHLDAILGQLESRAAIPREEVIPWLFGDLDRVNADRLREHFFKKGGAIAVHYASIWTASRIAELLAGFTSSADSAAIVRHFDAAGEHRAALQAQLEPLIQAERGEPHERALMKDMRADDYRSVQAMDGISLGPYVQLKSGLESTIAVAEWAVIVPEWIACGAVGVVTGALGVVKDVFTGILDLIGGAWNLLWSLAYFISAGLVGSENWLATKGAFMGIAEAVTNPGKIWDAYWEKLKREFVTIEGPLSDCRRAEFIVRKFVNGLINLALIFVAGVGLVKGGVKLVRQTAKRIQTRGRRVRGEGPEPKLEEPDVKSPGATTQFPIDADVRILLKRHGFVYDEATGIASKAGGKITVSRKADGKWIYRERGTVVEEYTIARFGDKSAKGTRNFFQAHHPIQDKWAKQRLGKLYDRDEAPSLVLRDSFKDSPHQSITAEQAVRKNAIGTRTYLEERSLMEADLRSAGVPEEIITKTRTQVDDYFRQIRDKIKDDSLRGDIFGNWKG